MKKQIVTAVCGLGLGWLAALPTAAAFDCGQAQTSIETAICADPALTAADNRLGTVYSALRERLTEDQRKSLQLSERAWLRQRQDMCDDAPPDKACILAQTTARADLLEGRPRYAAADAPAVTPVIVTLFEPGKDKSMLSGREVQIVYPQIEGTTDFARAFNKAAKQATLGGDVFKPDEPPFYFTSSYIIHYAAPGFISVEIDNSVFAGGAHGLETASGLTVQGTGKVLAIADFLDAGGQTAAITFCKAALATAKKERSGGEINDTDLTDDAVAASIQDATKWWFGKDGATVHYDPYAVGAYAEGSYDCVIPWANLKLMAKSIAPLPFPP